MPEGFKIIFLLPIIFPKFPRNFKHSKIILNKNLLHITFENQWSRQVSLPRRISSIIQYLMSLFTYIKVYQTLSFKKINDLNRS